jgi:hypothetical protein
MMVRWNFGLDVILDTTKIGKSLGNGSRPALRIKTREMEDRVNLTESVRYFKDDMQSVTSVNLLEDVAIPFRLRIDNITFLVAIVYVAAILVMHFFYVIQGRWDTSMPMIEEVGTSAPNGMILSAVFSCAAFLVLLVLSAVTVWGEVYSIFPKWYVRFSQTMAFAIPILIMVLANFRLDDLILAIWFGGMPFQLLSWVYCLVFLFITYQSQGPKMRKFRIAIVVVEILAFLCEWVPMGLSFDRDCTKRAIGQLVFVTSVITFFTSFKAEIGQVKIDLLIFEEQE